MLTKEKQVKREEPEKIQKIDQAIRFALDLS